MGICTYTRTYVHIPVHVHIHVHVLVPAHVPVHMYIYMYEGEGVVLNTGGRGDRPQYAGEGVRHGPQAEKLLLTAVFGWVVGGGIGAHVRNPDTALHTVERKVHYVSFCFGKTYPK